MKSKYRRGICIADKCIKAHKNAIMLFIAMITLVLVPQASATGLNTLSIGGDTQGTVGNYATVYVNATGASDIGSIQLDILFDPNIIIATSVTPESLIAGSSPVYTIDNDIGKITIAAMSVTGIAGDGSLAKINYSMIGSGESRINISIEDISNVTNSPITPENIVNGTITVTDDIEDMSPPSINSVELSNSNPNVGDQIDITVSATDDVGITNVTVDIFGIGNVAIDDPELGIVASDHIELIKGDSDIWSGMFVAKEGNYSVNVSARDAAGNVMWDNSTTYNVVPSVQPIVSFEFGVHNSALTVEQDISVDYILTIKNTGESIDTYYLTIYNPNSAIVELSETNIDIDAGQESTATLTVMGNVAGTYTVDVIAESKNNDTLNKTVRTVTTVIPPIPRYVKEFGVGNGAIAGFIVGNVAVTNIDIVDHWFLVVVGGTDPIVGYPLVGTGTVYLKANESINVPILVSVPAGAIAGDYELYAGIYNYDDRIIAPEKLLEPIKGPVISTVS